MTTKIVPVLHNTGRYFGVFATIPTPLHFVTMPWVDQCFTEMAFTLTYVALHYMFGMVECYQSRFQVFHFGVKLSKL